MAAGLRQAGLRDDDFVSVESRLDALSGSRNAKNQRDDSNDQAEGKKTFHFV
jgi:hypothetical protein